MRFKTSVRIFRGKLDMTPLLDVMFLLVIFFLISTSYDFQRGFEVQLPESEAPLVRGNKLVVVIASKGDQDGALVYFNNQQVSWEDLEVRLAERISDRSMPSSTDQGKRSRRPTISLKVDKEIPYGYVLRILSLANKLEVKVNQVVSSPGR
jgi:biopolymer transport protein ExbD